ncbi:MAG TPA: response regulator [Blastocatellia bacterium]|nr:response regulator [Blastocatellia bacterium]
MQTISVAVGSILLVEDNTIDLDIALRAFDRCELYKPLQIARNGEDVLDFMQQWEEGQPVPSVILLDLDLPKVGGLEVLRRLKSHEDFKTIPVIMLTNSGDAQDIHEAYQLGANSYVQKPMDFGSYRELANQIEHYWCRVNTPPR